MRKKQAQEGGKCEGKASSHLEELQNENPLEFSFRTSSSIFRDAASGIMSGRLKDFYSFKVEIFSKVEILSK